MTLLHHDAAHSDERSRGESPLFSAEQAGDGDITASADLTIGLNGDSAPQVVQDERLMSLCQAEFPRKTSIFDTGPARGTCTTIVASD